MAPRKGLFNVRENQRYAKSDRLRCFLNTVGFIPNRGKIMF